MKKIKQFIFIYFIIKNYINTTSITSISNPTSSINNSLKSSNISFSKEEIRKRKEKILNNNIFNKKKNRIIIYKKIKTERYSLKINNLILIIYHLNKYPFALNMISDKINENNIKLILFLFENIIKEEDIDSIFEKYLKINNQLSNIFIFNYKKSLIYGKIKENHLKKVLFQTYYLINNLKIKPKTILLKNLNIENIPLKKYQTIYFKRKTNKNIFFIERFYLKSFFIKFNGEYIVIKKKWNKFKIYRIGFKNISFNNISEILKYLKISQFQLFESFKLLIYEKC